MISDETNSFVMASDGPDRARWAFLADPIPGFLTVIIPVYKDSEGLAVTLKSLEKQTLPRTRYEVLVANDGGHPEISRLCREMNVIEINLPVNEGSYAARNRGLEQARGEFIAFADADVRVDANWLAAGMKALRTADLAAGRTIVDVAGQRSTTNLYQLCFSFPTKTNVESGSAQTVNLFARRQVFCDIGFFDARLRSGGDVEWTSRATREGAKRLVYAEDAIVHHPPRSYQDLWASSERILYGTLAYKKLHGRNTQRVNVGTKSLWRFLLPPNPRWMRSAGLSRIEFARVYLFMWWLKLQTPAVLLRARWNLRRTRDVPPAFPDGAGRPGKVSIIINNFNYGRFLSQCIESALAQTYRDCEVIVVDDGSTDDSASIIRGFGDRVIPVLKVNGGQASAYRAGFEKAAGDLVLFLDADDYLREDCIDRVVAAWRPGVAKAQFRLSIVDENGAPVNARTPSGKMADRNALKMMRLFGAYCSPPASGNVFSSAFLRRILPFPNEAELLFAADAPAIFSAPYFGEIVSIEESLAFYRRHGAANSSGTLEEFDPVAALRRLEEERGRDGLRDRSMALLFSRTGESAATRFREPSRAKRDLCQLRMGEAMSGSFLKRLRAASGGIRGSLHWDGYSLSQRLSACVWFASVACLPYPAAEGFIKVALNMKNRPRWMGRFLGGGSSRAASHAPCS